MLHRSPASADNRLAVSYFSFPLSLSLFFYLLLILFSPSLPLSRSLSFSTHTLTYRRRGRTVTASRQTGQCLSSASCKRQGHHVVSFLNQGLPYTTVPWDRLLLRRRYRRAEDIRHTHKLGLGLYHRVG